MDLRPFRLVLALALPALATRLPAQSPAPTPLDTIHVVSRAAPPIVTSQRSFEVIGREEIESRPVRSVSDLLAFALGADLQRRSAAQGDLAIRGSSLGQVLVLVDGVRVSDLQTAHFDLDLVVPVDVVERIEILRGPASTLYGPDAVGGVVNVVTRTRSDWQHARVQGGSFGTIAGAAGVGRRAGDATELHVAADAERSEGHRDGTDYRILQVVAGGTRRIADGSFDLDLGVGARDFGATDFYAPAPSFERTRSHTASLRYTLPGGRGWTTSALLATRRHTDDFILRRADPAFYRNQHLTWQHSAELTAKWMDDGRGVALGAEAFDARLESARLGDRRERRAGAFMELTAGAPDGPSASAGIRVDRSTTLGTTTSPAIAASLPIGAAFTLRGSANRGIRGPSWTERYYVDPANVASPDLGPERFWAGEIGVRALPRWGHADLAVFVREAADLIDWVKPVGAAPTDPWTTANLESARYRGLEGSLGLADVGGFSLRFSATGLRFDAAAADSVTGKYALRPLTRTFGTSVGRTMGAARISLDARHARREGEDAYLHADVRTALSLGRATVHLDLLNLLDAAYLDASARPVAGRGLYVGVLYR